MEEKKSVKISIGTLVCLIVIVVLVMIVIGFGMYIYFLKNSKIETSQPIADLGNVQNEKTEETKKSIKIDDTKEYVYEKDRTEINEMFDKGSPYEYTYTDTIKFPFININSEDAKRANETLEQQYAQASTSLKRENNELSEYTAMSYEANILDKIASVETETSDIILFTGGAVVNYKIYNFDLNTGKQLSNEEVLEILNVDETDFMKKMNTMIEYYYYQEAYQECESLNEFLATCDVNHYQLFVLNENELEVYIPCTGIPLETMLFVKVKI